MFSATKTVELNGDIDEETAIALALAASESSAWNSDEDFVPQEWISSLDLSGAPTRPLADHRVPGQMSSMTSTNPTNVSTPNPMRYLPSLDDADDDLLQALEASLSDGGSTHAEASVAAKRAPMAITQPPQKDEALFRLILERMPGGKNRCIVAVDNTITGHVVGKNFAVVNEIIAEVGGAGSIKYLKRGLSKLVDSFDASKTLMLIEADHPRTVAILKARIEQRIADILASGLGSKKLDTIPKSPSPVRKLAGGRSLASLPPTPTDPPTTSAAASQSFNPVNNATTPLANLPVIPISSAPGTAVSSSRTDSSPAAMSAAINSAIRMIEADLVGTRPRVLVRVRQDLCDAFVGENFFDANEICRVVGAQCRMRFVTENDSLLVKSLESMSLLLIEADSKEALVDARMRAESRIGQLLRARKTVDKDSGPKVTPAASMNLNENLGANMPPSSGPPSNKETFDRDIELSKAKEANPVIQDNTSSLLQRILSNMPYLKRSRTIIAVPRSVGCLLVGKAYSKTNEISNAVGGNCKITFLSKEKHPLMASLDDAVSVLYIEADTTELVEEASSKVFERMSSLMLNSSDVISGPPIPKTKPRLLIPLGTPLSRERERHIIVDNSNVFIAAQNRGRDGLGPDNLVRLNADALSRLLSGPARLPGLRAVAGSKPPSTNDIWQRWESAGFTVKVSCRDVGTNKESMVDEFLHAQAYAAVMQHIGDIPGENTLVLCTGDGNLNGGFSNFVHVAQSAAYSGWRVEIWSWRHSLSSRFRELADELSDRVKICLLDDFEAKVIFRAKARIAPTTTVAQDASSTAASPVPVEEAESTMAPAFDDDDNMCIICMEEPRSRIILPCRHFTHCATCVDLLEMECHMCRGRIEAIEIAI